MNTHYIPVLSSFIQTKTDKSFVYILTISQFQMCIRDSYGSYELSDNAITLKMSDKSYSGAVKESGSEIRFGNSSFTDWTDNVGPTDPMLSVFQQ